MAQEDTASAEEMLEQALDDIPLVQPDEVETVLAADEAKKAKPAAPEESVDSAPQEEGEVEAEVEVEATVEESTELEKATEESEEAALTPRSQERFQKLANERNELRAQLEQHQAYMAQMQQQYQQLAAQQQQAAQSRQEALAAQQLEILKAQQADSQKRAERERYESMSVADQWKHDTEQAALKRAEQMFGSKFQSLEQKFQAMEQEKQQAQQRYQRQQTLDTFHARSVQAAQPLLEVFPEAERQGKLADLDDAILTYAAAYAIPPEEASKKFKALLDSYADAKIKGRTRQAPQAGLTKAAPIAPKTGVPLKGKPSNGGLEKPTWDQLKKHGYDDYLDWLERGQRPLA